MERLLEGMASPTMKSRISAVEDLQVRPRAPLVANGRRARRLRRFHRFQTTAVIGVRSASPRRPATGHARAGRRESRRPRSARRLRPRGVTPTGARTARTPRPIVATVACRLVSCVRWRARIRRNPGSRLARARFRRTSQPPRAYALTRATDPFTPHDVRFDGRTTARTYRRTPRRRTSNARRLSTATRRLPCARRLRRR